MKITAITATYQRPEAMELCAKYLKRQTRQPDQWLVLHGPEPMPRKILRAIEENQIEGDVVAFVEDDDYFRSDWLQWVHDGVERGYQIVGEGNAVYYNPRFRWWSECHNVRHAALVQTAVHRDTLELVANVIRSFESPFFDTRVWQLDVNKFLALPERHEDRRVIGIKGLYGAAGYSTEHGAQFPAGTHADPSMAQLWRWIKGDAAAYAKFKLQLTS